MSKREVRSFPVGDVEFRVEDREDGSSELVSLAPPWGTLSVDLGGFREQFQHGALDLSGDVVATVEHSTSSLLGRTGSGTLALRNTDKGLEYRVELPDTTAGRDLRELVKRGDIFGSSFEFRVKAGGEEWTEDEAGAVTRTVTDAELFQVGPVTRPAYPEGAEIALRSHEQASTEEAERLKREADEDTARRRRLELAELDTA